MKQQWLIGTAFAVSMLLSAPVVRAEQNLISDKEMDMVASASVGTFVYVPSNVRDIMLAVHSKIQDRGLDSLWSDLRAGAHIAQASLMNNAVAKAMDALKKNRKSYDATECAAALDLLAAYQAELSSGDAVIAFDDVTRRGCKCKSFSSIRVCGNITTGSLTVTGNETVGGTLTVTGALTAAGGITITGNETITGNLTVTGSGSFGDSLLVEGVGSFADGLFVNGAISATSFILGSPSWAYAWTQQGGTTLTVADATNVLFDNATTGTQSSADIVLGTSGGATTITFNTLGRYLVEFYILGALAGAANTTLVFEVFNNTTTAVVPATIYQSNTQVTVSNGAASVFALTSLMTRGAAIINVATVGQSYGIRNVSGGTVTFAAAPANSHVNASVLITRLN